MCLGERGGVLLVHRLTTTYCPQEPAIKSDDSISGVLGFQCGKKLWSSCLEVLGSGRRNFVCFVLYLNNHSESFFLLLVFLPSFFNKGEREREREREYYYSHHSNSFRAKCKTTSPNISVTKYLGCCSSQG
jgi:hypothetical protein